MILTRLLAAATLSAAAFIALPAAAQDDAPASGGDKITQVIVYGDEACPVGADDEILVCATLPEADRYRVPEIFRGDPLNPKNQAWTQRVLALQRTGRFGTDSCSPSGLGGFTGCMGQMIDSAYAERRATDKTNWQALIAEERARRLAGIDTAAADVEAAVIAEEKAMAERERKAQELEDRGGAPDEADAAGELPKLP